MFVWIYNIALLQYTGACFSKTSTHYCLPDWAYLRQNFGKEWFEHKLIGISELNTHENLCIDSLFGLIYELQLVELFYF